MKHTTILIAAILLSMSCAKTEESPFADVIGMEPIESLLLYPEGQDADAGLPGALGPLVNNGLSGDDEAINWGRIKNVGDKAHIEIYMPENCCGKMVVICPPGGYDHFSYLTEGVYAARWLAHQGVASCLLFHRLPNGHPEAPLRDVQNAFRYCRSRAAEWGISEIGVMGMSAGGHLAALASTQYVDEATRPDFQILLYPLITMDKNCPNSCRKSFMGEEYTQEYLDKFCPEKNVAENTPRAFMAHSNMDKTIKLENTTDYYEALVHNNVDAELDIYPYGSHGWGFGDQRLMSPEEIEAAGDSNLIQDQIAGCRDELYSAMARWLGVRKPRAIPERESIKGPDQILKLYPEGQEVDKGLPGAEGPRFSNGQTDSVWIKVQGFTHPGGGDNAQIELYFPEKPNGQVIILCPGGGYNQLNSMCCGTLGGNWLSERGFVACVLKYRMPAGNPEIPLQDVQNVIRYCKYMGKEWGTSQVGVLGGSAGGHLAALASTLYKDEATKPDFAILLYPLISAVGLPKEPGCNREFFGDKYTEEERAHYSPELNVTPDTPPTFIACNRKDFILKCEHFTLYQKALRQNEVHAEFHAYPEGYHGWAFLSDEFCALLNKDNSNVYMLADPAGTHYEDQLGECREDFENSLLRFLKDLR